MAVFFLPRPGVGDQLHTVRVEPPPPEGVLLARELALRRASRPGDANPEDRGRGRRTDPPSVNWYKLGRGLPRGPVNDLEYQASTNTLFAATYGRSVWSLQLDRDDQ